MVLDYIRLGGLMYEPTYKRVYLNASEEMRHMFGLRNSVRSENGPSTLSQQGE